MSNIFTSPEIAYSNGMNRKEADMRWTVSSETGVLTDVLLCRPEYYRWLETNTIAQSTLSAEHQFDHLEALAQYEGLIDILGKAGVQTHFLDTSPSHQYQVYTRDSSQTTPWGPVLTQLALPQRRGEYVQVLNFHQKECGFFRHASIGVLEGGDIHIIRPGLIIVGHSGVRTNLQGATEFANWFEAKGWEIRLQSFSSHFLHLDVLFCMATDTIAVACPEALGQDFIDFLQARGIGIIPASYAEVMAMNCNLLSLGGNRVISPEHSVRINDELRLLGVEVFDPPLDVFARGGGSVHCMTMPLRREPLQ